MLEQMTEHMLNNNMFNHSGYAYKEGNSTIHALIDLMETWCENIDKNQQNLNMFLDMSSAFDCVSHQLLMDKMEV